jgi:nucleotide-binding universal stress UspA family protein
MKEGKTMPRFAPKSVLCPVDLSSASPDVLRWASLFAETYHAKLEVLHADWLDYPPYFLPSQVAEWGAEAKHHRGALNEDLVTLARDSLGTNVPHDITIVQAHPVEAILKHAEERHSDLIVMGSHGRSGVARMRLGSVAENVMREAATPTLVVRALPHRPAPPAVSRVLCPVNFTDYGFRCLELSAEVATAFGAELIVMHSVEQSYADLEQTQEKLCEWVPEIVRRHCYLTEAVRHGNAGEQILLTAREKAVDLIVLGAPHRPFLEFTTLGTTTERVVRHADSAVLVLSGKRAATSAEPAAEGVTRAT